MAELDRRQLNRRQIEDCLKTAVEDIKPDVLDRVNLTAPQDKEMSGPVFHIRRRVIGTLVAACLCMIMLAGGTYTYQNGKVDSVIGIDVNPSVELSVNRKNKVISAKALNQDAELIMQDMDLKGVDLKVAVNAVIGSLVTHGYLDDLDNAILVTVSNDSIRKASVLRSSVVDDIQNTLEEKQLKAKVIDQQVIEEDVVKKLADKYDISYGKAYFLKELIEQNASLSMEDMKKLAPMTMEEISKEIGERSYAVNGKINVMEETTKAATSKETTVAISSSVEKTTTVEKTTEVPTSTIEESQTKDQTTTMATPSEEEPAATSATEEKTTSEQVVVNKGKIKIDYVDYDSGAVMVYFKTRVKWKNPTVSIKDSDGITYASKVVDTDSNSCEIEVKGLDGGKEYTFILGGVSPKSGRRTTVKGIFETPVIGDGNADDVDDETEETQEETQEETNQTQETSQDASASSESESDTENTSAKEETKTQTNQEESSLEEETS
jgi:hypothetical protein